MASDNQQCFLDSNIWIYALAEHQDPEKQEVARRLVSDKSIAISTQVINEVCRNLIKKSDFPENQIQRLVQTLYNRCQVTSLNVTILLRASDLRSRYQLSFWDSLIVSSALTSKVSMLYSEDMQHGLIVAEQLTVINPF
ncbi:MAG: PIN domain-containing protein [Cyanobacteria bacterium P01_A01_bin.116]